MSYSETVKYLYNLQKYGIKFGLHNITKLTSALENPHASFASIHVAGTNGKGSTSAIIAFLLQASGLKVGLFTSPHLVSFTERISINGEAITEGEVVELTEEIRAKISNLTSRHPDFSTTFFEVVTAMALLYFKRKEIDIAVIEVGMGGRLDATNIITPKVSVITNISYDHKKFLGNTLTEIAHEKAGIIKDRIPVISSSQAPEVLEVIEAKAKDRDTRVYLYGRDFSSELISEDSSGIYFDYRVGNSVEIHDAYLPLTGEHQMQNASVAIKTVELLSKKLTSHFSLLTSHTKLRSYLSPSPTPPVEGGAIYKPSPLAGEGKGEGYHRFLNATWYHSIREGLENVRWPGRLELIGNEPPILIDGAHNPAAAAALSHALAKNFLWEYEKIVLILGIMDDKDIKGIMKPLLPLASEIILTAPDYERAASPAKLARIAASLGFSDVRTAPSVKDAIESAITSSSVDQRKTLVVITGSFYTIGEAKEILGETAILGSLREVP